MTPSLRRPFGILGIVVGLTVYVLIVASLAGPVTTMHPLVQAPIWLFLGTVWAFPLRPLMIWIETGRWRPRK